jgi:hypothetical protein
LASRSGDFGQCPLVGRIGDVDDIIIAPDKAVSYAIINAGIVVEYRQGFGWPDILIH